ncbi:g7215 [Coccomyxa viridis]|uniref:G7215 protein n=1 Tax=Coccomyxa viridis TaxID=1274662 RepID=A0ABP1G244_9CHLO
MCPRLGDSYLTDPVQYLDPKKKKIWFAGGPAIDQDIRARFGADVEAAAAGKLGSWQEGYDALAFIILGDQFTRNVYRGTPKMYSLDGETLSLAKHLIDSGGQGSLHLAHRVWLYMPFMHSEELQDQEDCIRHAGELLTQTQALPGGGEPLAAALVDNQKYARTHRDVLLKWGRFPHRNGILGRESTPEEKQGMKDGTVPSF